MKETTLKQLQNHFGDLQHNRFRGQDRVVIDAERAFDFFHQLKECGFDLLVDVTCVDYLQYRSKNRDEMPPGRYGLVYLLCNTYSNERLTVRIYLDDEDSPTVPSVFPLWNGADWLEREVYDMFGIRFEGHPNLKRILMPPEFTAYPLRKDYPLQGRGERHNFPVIARAEA